MKLLIVVDFQQDFVDGALGFEKARLLDDRIAEKITAYRKRGDAVLFTKDTHEENYPDTQEGKHLPVIHCVKGTPGWELYGKVKELAETFGRNVGAINSRIKKLELKDKYGK